MSAEARAEALRLYLDAAGRLEAASERNRVAAEAMALARQEAEAARVAWREARSDVEAAVQLGREAGLLDPDQLRLVSEAPAPEPGPGPTAEQVREQEHRTSPGYSKAATYQALRAEPQRIEAVASAAGLRPSAAGGALVDLWHVGLARREREGAHTVYSLADRQHLPVTAADLAAWGTLRRTAEGAAQVAATVAQLRAGQGAAAEARARTPRRTAKAATRPDRAAGEAVPAKPRLVPAPEPHPTASPEPLPEVVVQTDRLGRTARVRPEAPVPWQPGDLVRVYDDVHHYYRPGRVVEQLRRGKHRGWYVVQLGGTTRTVEAAPVHVKAREASA